MSDTRIPAAGAEPTPNLSYFADRPRVSISAAVETRPWVLDINFTKSRVSDAELRALRAEINKVLGPSVSPSPAERAVIREAKAWAVEYRSTLTADAYFKSLSAAHARIALNDALRRLERS